MISRHYYGYSYFIVCVHAYVCGILIFSLAEQLANLIVMIPDAVLILVLILRV